jgi:hypothetical protein
MPTIDLPDEAIFSPPDARCLSFAPTAAFSAIALGFAVVGESSPRVFEKGPPEGGPELQLHLSPREHTTRDWVKTLAIPHIGEIKSAT